MLALPPQTFRWSDPHSWPWVFYVWIVMIGAGYIPKLWRIWRQQSAKFWLPVSATIDSTHVDAAPNRFLQIGRRSAQFQANLNYSFSVGGTTYTGQYSRMFRTEAEALEFIRDLWGKTLTAQVNPAKPTKSLVFDSAIQNLIRARPSRTFEQMNYQNPDARSLLVHSVFTVVRYPRGRWISPEHVGPRWRHSWTRRRAINILCGLPGGNLRGLFSSGPGSHQDRGNFPPQ